MTFTLRTIFYVGVFVLLLAIWPRPIFAEGKEWWRDYGYPIIYDMPSEDALEGGYSWDVVWDEEGIAYIGRDRLWRWDGSNWKGFGPRSLSNLRGMAFDGEGLLWLASFNEFGVFDPETLQYESRMDWIPPDYHGFGESWSLHVEGDTIWLGTETQLFRIRENDFHAWEFSGEHRTIFHFLPSGIYAHQVDHGIWTLKGEEMVLANADPRIAAKSVIFMEEDSAGRLLAISGHGMFWLGKENREIVDAYDLGSLTGKSLSSICRINDSSLAIGTLAEGLHVLSYSGKQNEVKRTQRFFDDVLILNLRRDKNHQFWMLGTEGIWRMGLSFSVTKNLFVNDQYPLGFVRKISVSENQIFVSNDNGFFEIQSGFEPENKRFLSISRNGSSNSEDLKGAILFDSYDKLMRYKDGELSVLHWFGKALRSFEVSETGQVYTSFNDAVGLYRMTDELGLEWVAEFPTLNRLNYLEDDDRGRIWGWSPKTPLYEFSHNELGVVESRRHDTLGGVDLFKTTHAIDVAKNGPVLISEDRLLRMKGVSDEWESAAFEVDMGMPQAMEFRDRDGLLEGWLVYWDEVLKISLIVEVEWPYGGAMNWKFLPWVNLKELGRVCQIELIEDEGDTLLIAGMKGMLIASRELSGMIPSPDKPIIWDVSLGEAPAKYRKWDYGDRGIAYKFSSPKGSGFYPVQYQTRLVGLETEWAEPEALGRRDIGQLFMGHYSLEVRALDPFGRVSPVAAVSFRILPPWYFTTWAFLLWAALLLGIVAISILVTKLIMKGRQVALEAQVQERTRELRKAYEFKNEFVATLSHEIRNPLNGVIGLIRLLKADTAPKKKHLTSLRETANYLQATVEDVLDISKLESGKVTYEYDLFDMRKVVAGVISTYTWLASSKGLALTQTVDVPDACGILSDARKLQQVLGNLTSNAVKFTSEGSVEIRVTIEKLGAGKGLLTMIVSDSGPGIPDKDRKHVFEKFYQGRGSDQKTMGTGLGLTLVNGFVRGLNGTVELFSIPGEGTTFEIRIPVDVATLEEAPVTSISPADVSGRPLVLVVEDVEYNRLIMEESLSELGYVVDSADDGNRGFEMGLTGKYGIILLDGCLPGMTGLEIAGRLRESGKLSPGTLIIGITAEATVEMKEQCLNGGMDAFLTKPLNMDHLNSILNGIPSEETAPRTITSRGLLGEMSSVGDWETNKSRWLGFYEEHLSELESAMRAENPEQIRYSAHKLLGHLRMLKTSDFSDTLEALMKAARSRDMPAIGEAWGRFEKGNAPFMEEYREL